MRLEEIDTKLERLHGAAERIDADLLEVERDTNRQLLDGSQLEGDTARRWETTSAALMQLWEGRGLLAGLLERAVKLRGNRARLRSDRLAELRKLIEGASIECSSQHGLLAGRDSPDSSQPTVRLTPGGLVERMSAAVDEVKAVLAQIATAWDAFAPRLHRIRTIVEESCELCLGLGDSDPRELDLARQRLTQLSEALGKDPLSVAAADIEALERSVAALHADLGALAALRDEIGERLAAARSLLEELLHAQGESEAAHAEVLVKIEAPAVAEPVALVGIEAELKQVVELSEAGEWRQASDALAQWTTRASSLVDEARMITADNRAPIEARNQLRGRLDAYQAKAKRLGRIEDAELSDLYERAHGTLYTAPTDLEHAEALLRQYQQALAADPAAKELRM